MDTKQTPTKSTNQANPNQADESTTFAESPNSNKNSKPTTDKPTDKPTEKQTVSTPSDLSTPIKKATETPATTDKEKKAETESTASKDPKDPKEPSQATKQSPEATNDPQSKPEKGSDTGKNAQSKDPAEKSQEKQAPESSNAQKDKPESSNAKNDDPGKTKNAAGNSELSSQAKEAVKKALEKMSSADSPSTKMIVDKLLQPSEPKNGISAKEKISAALMENPTFKENFGSMMNGEKYKSELVRNLQEFGTNIYQAAVRSLQTDDLSDVHDLIFLSQQEIQKVGIPIEEFDSGMYF